MAGKKIIVAGEEKTEGKKSRLIETLQAKGYSVEDAGIYKTGDDAIGALLKRNDDFRLVLCEDLMAAWLRLNFQETQNWDYAVCVGNVYQALDTKKSIIIAPYQPLFDVLLENPGQGSE